MKGLILIFTLTLSLSVLACGGSDKSADSSDTTTTDETTEVSG